MQMQMQTTTHSHCNIAYTCFFRYCLFADFGTGVYHWSVDNYGSGETPLVGSQIAAFQGHHQRPWTITERQVANNIHKVRCTKSVLIM